MHFEATRLAGVHIVTSEVHRDERGFFSRLGCVEQFAVAGLAFAPRQTSLSHNLACFTLRGMHYCLEPESKLVHCVRGRMFDVAVDLRRESATFRKWIGLELEAGKPTGLFIPPGVAHGFLTLAPDTDVLYQIDRVYRPGFDAGVRWNDAAFGIDWPATPAVMNARDAGYADFKV